MRKINILFVITIFINGCYSQKKGIVNIRKGEEVYMNVQYRLLKELNPVCFEENVEYFEDEKFTIYYKSIGNDSLIIDINDKRYYKNISGAGTSSFYELIFDTDSIKNTLNFPLSVNIESSIVKKKIFFILTENNVKSIIVKPKYLIKKDRIDIANVEIECLNFEYSNYVKLSSICENKKW